VAAARRKHAGLDLSWPSGLGFERDQAGELGIGTANTCGHLWRWIRARLGHYDGEGGEQRRHARVPDAMASQKLRHLAYKLREVYVMLTIGLRWPELQRKMAGGEVLRRRRVGVRGEGRC
jgi:hypothetical protein